jgi:hypothetical protein
MPAIAQEHTSNSNTPNALHHPQPTLAAHLTTDTRCQHRYANQKRCRLNTARRDTRFCVHHLKFYQSSEVSAALTANLAELKSPQALNDFLSRLLLLLAQNKISPRRAAVLGYITNQLLRTIHAIDQKAQQAKRDEENAEVHVNVDIGRPTWNPLHDSPEDDPNAPQNAKRRFIIDMPRPQREPLDASVSSGGSSDPCFSPNVSTRVDTPETQSGAEPASPSPVDATQNATPAETEHTPSAPAPNKPTNDDPPPATHPKNIPLPRWGEPDPVTKYTYREPERRSTYGPPRMSTRRRTRRHARVWNGRDCNGFVTQNCSPVYAGFLCWETATRFCIWRGVRRNLFANP